MGPGATGRRWDHGTEMGSWEGDGTMGPRRDHGEETGLGPRRAQGHRKVTDYAQVVGMPRWNMTPKDMPITPQVCPCSPFPSPHKELPSGAVPPSVSREGAGKTRGPSRSMLRDCLLQAGF